MRQFSFQYIDRDDYYKPTIFRGWTKAALKAGIELAREDMRYHYTKGCEIQSTAAMPDLPDYARKGWQGLAQEHFDAYYALSCDVRLYKRYVRYGYKGYKKLHKNR